MPILAFMLLAGCGGKKQNEGPGEKGTEPPLPGDPAEGPSVYHAGLGEIHLRYGFAEQAAASFRRAIAIEKDPEGKAQYQFQLGQAYLESGNAEEALRAMEEAIDTSKSRDRKCDMYIEIAKICARREHWQEAKQAYRFVVDHSQQDWQRRVAWAELSSIYARTQEIDDLIATLENTIERNPQDVEAHLRLAEIFTATKPNPQRAIAIYEALYREGELSSTLMQRLASLHLRVGGVSRAQMIYERLIEMSGEGKKNRYRLALAQVHEKSNDLSPAEELYKAVLAENPTDWERGFTKQRLYRLYERQGSLAAIVAGLEKRATDNPEDAGALAELSEIYATVGRDHQKAIVVTERLLVFKPDDAALLQRLADLHEKSGQKEKAIEALKALVSLLPKPEQVGCLERMARLHSQMGNNKEALNRIRELVALNPNKPETHVRAASLYLENSRAEEALAEYEKAIALSTSAEQRDGLRAQLAGHLFDIGDYPKAERIYRRLAEASASRSLKDMAKERLAALHLIQEKGR